MKLDKLRLNNNEITIGEYDEYLSIVFNGEYSDIERDTRIIALLSNSTIEEVCALPQSEFNKLQKDLKKLRLKEIYNKTSVTIDDITYKSKSTKYVVKLNVREAYLMNELFEGKPFPTPSVIMGVLFRPEDEMKDYSIKKIMNRSEIFKQLTVDYVLPYLSFNNEEA